MTSVTSSLLGGMYGKVTKKKGNTTALKGEEFEITIRGNANHPDKKEHSKEAPEVLSYLNREDENELCKLPFVPIRETDKKIQLALVLEDQDKTVNCGFWFYKEQIHKVDYSFLVPKWVLKLKLLEAQERAVISPSGFFRDCPFLMVE